MEKVDGCLTWPYSVWEEREVRLRLKSRDSVSLRRLLLDVPIIHFWGVNYSSQTNLRGVPVLNLGTRTSREPGRSSNVLPTVSMSVVEECFVTVR